MPSVRRIRADEAVSLRAFRLRALAEAPTAFGSTLARETSFADATWQERAERGASGIDSVTFVAEHEGRWVGLASGLAFDPDVPDDARPELVSMFVAPEARGRALGEALVDAVVDWAASRRATGLCLWVTATNAAAIRLYEKCGFRPTGEEKPLAHSPALMLVRMARDFAQ